LPDVVPAAKGKNATRRKQTQSNAHDDDYFRSQQDEEDDGDQDVIQPNIKFASLKEQSLFYGDITDDYPIDYCDVKVGQGSSEELVTAIKDFYLLRAQRKQEYLEIMNRVCDFW
jgi:hypothetical protein